MSKLTLHRDAFLKMLLLAKINQSLNMGLGSYQVHSPFFIDDFQSALKRKAKKMGKKE